MGKMLIDLNFLNIWDKFCLKSIQFLNALKKLKSFLLFKTKQYEF